ncbi:hypothetical protein CC78DRAFT_533336 [Lojkania enalia]|uniref:CENP-C homolog n=1 Tax=Lojkania enalia TaxID=147567 RepID=A0A9P4KDU6_9PLEO|nr:hypothetical protein CC78DRAFT_533336 [Didymosphaeria enalia]
MDIDDSSVPEINSTNHTNPPLLRNTRTNLPPPKARSPMKTTLGSSPRRQSSMGPRVRQTDRSSPNRAASHLPVTRRLDFDQEESSLQETPALSGSGQRRGQRRNVYSLEPSPSNGHSATLEESLVQEEIAANEDSAMIDGFIEESFAGGVGEDSMAGAEATEHSVEAQQTTDEEEPVKQPSRKGRGRKRKSDVLESAVEESTPISKTRRRRPAALDERASHGQKKANDTIAPAPKPQGRPGRPKRTAKVTEEAADEESTDIAEKALDDSTQIEEHPAPNPVKPRGRPPGKAKAQLKPATAEKKAEKPATFKKPELPKKSQVITASKSREKENEQSTPLPGTFVNAWGKQLSEDEVEHMSVTSTASRFGRGRSLSVFRQVEIDESTSIGRTGRHRVQRLEFWRNEKGLYDRDGSLTSIVKNETPQEPMRMKRAGRHGRPKDRNRALTAIEEDDDDDLQPYETGPGVLPGVIRGFDAATGVSTDEHFEETIAWAEKGIVPIPVPDAQFKFTKLASAPGSFFSWGIIDLPPEAMKRTKNSRRMHMAFHVTSGKVSVRVGENDDFIVHKGGIWQVPRGNTYSITNIATKESRIFFAQALEQEPAEAEN